jgi:hypothetical protein
MLSSLFLKAYNSFKVGDSGNYLSAASYDRLDQMYSTRCVGGVRPEDGYKVGIPIKATSSFCSILPIVSKAKLYVGDTKRIATSTVANIYSVKKGIYRLEFNTLVDPEQQPLRRIMIDWGDDKFQVVTDQDQRPTEDNKHVFYHYYFQSTTLKPIRIRAYDNWGLYSKPI